MKEMKRNLLFVAVGIMLFFMSACDNIHNPLLPEKKENGGTKHINPPTVNAAVPKINGQPQGAVYSAGDAAQALTVFASVSDDGTLSYQWYSNTVNSNEDGKKISGETGNNYTPPTTALGALYYYVVVTNTITDNGDGGKKTAAIASFPAMIQVNALVVVIKITGKVNGDEVIYSPDRGNVGDSITLDCTVAHTEKRSNLLNFSGAAIDPVNSTGSVTRTYTINAADASNGVITITAVFIHTNFELDPIAFENTAHITKTYGDPPFINAITTERSGSGAITYSSDKPAVASVNSSGQVTILKTGSAIITAEKAADTTYAEAQTNYTLTVAPKPVTITGLSAANKPYDGNTMATVTGTAVISGLVGGDAVTVVTGIAAFNNATAGDGKTVTFSGWSLTGADAGNYTLSAQPASVTANIESVSMIEMVPIPAGTFIMGSPDTEPSRLSQEAQRSVTLNGFYIGKYQVTQEQYQAVMGSNPSKFNSNPQAGETQGKRPVETVSWYDALVFCNKLSVTEGLSPAYRISGSTDPSVWGKVPTSYSPTWNAVAIVVGSNGYRLPTEEQWEYACRAGTTTMFNNGNNDYTNAALIGEVAWYNGNSGSKTHEVGLKAANNWGLYDMHGNVYEWCWDMEQNSTTYRVFRGGHAGSDAAALRSAKRMWNYPYTRGDPIGFRLVRP